MHERSEEPVITKLDFMFWFLQDMGMPEQLGKLDADNPSVTDYTGLTYSVIGSFPTYCIQVAFTCEHCGKVFYDSFPDADSYGAVYDYPECLCQYDNN